MRHTSVMTRSPCSIPALVEFQALLGGIEPATLTAGDDGAVVVRLVGDQPEDAMPFWLALEAIEGQADGATYAGDWTCAPILPDDPAEDHEFDAPGTWTIAPPA